MLDKLAQVDMSIYFQTVIFLIFIGLLLRLHWKMGSITHILANGLRYFVLLLIFIYLFLNWASDVNPSLRSSSILIMTLINIYMLWSVVVSAVELPYRRALASCVDGVCTSTDLERAFSTGKRFYKLRYFWSALSSGTAPWRFLRGIAAERTRDDLHRVFVSLDPKASLFGASLFAHFLQNQLDADKSQPADKRAERQRLVDALEKDAWLTEKTGDFLHQLLAAPEELQEKGLKAALKDAGKMA
jgi:hypothetical protein